MFSNKHRTADCLQDILDNIGWIEQYTHGLTAGDVLRDRMRYDAIERCLERLCEATARLGDRASGLMPDQPWQDIRGMGNRLRHAYDRIDFSIVWNVVSRRLPKLEAEAAEALERLPTEDPA